MKIKTLFFIFIAVWLTACSSNTAQPTPTLTSQEQLGLSVFNLRCAQCHAIVPDTVIIGPSLAGIATRAESRIPGYDAQAYIEESILSPKSYIVEGFPDTMPTNFGKELTSEEFQAVVAFLLTKK